jgi:hypothetical protein
MAPACNASNMLAPVGVLESGHDADPRRVRESAGIRHNIAQFCQAPNVIAEQNNTCVPA